MKKLILITAIFTSFTHASEALDKINAFNDSQEDKRNLYISEKCDQEKDAFKKYDCTNAARLEAFDLYPTRGKKGYNIQTYSKMNKQELKAALVNLSKAKADILNNSKSTDENVRGALDALNAEISFISYELM